jgi:hypothetical protein
MNSIIHICIHSCKYIHIPIKIYAYLCIEIFKRSIYTQMITYIHIWSAKGTYIYTHIHLYTNIDTYKENDRYNYYYHDMITYTHVWPAKSTAGRDPFEAALIYTYI